jgi:hypothetical protein
MNLAGGATPALQFAAVLQGEDLPAAAALPGEQAETVKDEPLQQALALDACGARAAAFWAERYR